MAPELKRGPLPMFCSQRSPGSRGKLLLLGKPREERSGVAARSLRLLTPEEAQPVWIASSSSFMTPGSAGARPIRQTHASSFENKSSFNLTRTDPRLSNVSSDSYFEDW